MTEFLETGNQHDPVLNPAGYTSHPSGVEVIEFARLLPLSIGAAVQYVMRRDHKGNATQDLDKAVWYMADALANRTYYRITFQMGKVIAPVIHYEPNATVKQFLAALYLPRPNASFWTARNPDIELARDLVLALREEY